MKIESAAQRAARVVRWVTNAKSGSAAVAQTILSRFLLMAINLINGVFTARHFGPSGRGTQAALSLWLPILTYMLTFGVPAALRYHGRKHAEQSSELFTASLVYSIVFGSLATIVGIIGVPFWLKAYGPENIRFAQELMFFAPLGMATLVLTAMLEVRLDFTFANASRYIPPFATFFVLVALVRFAGLSPMSAALAYIVPPAFMSVAIMLYLFRKISLSLADFARSSRRLIGYGIRTYGADLLGTFGQQVDQLLVVGLLTAADLGMYTVGLQASRVLLVFQTSLNTVLLPKAAGLPVHRVIELVERSARITMALTASAGACLVLALPILLPSLYGHDFVQAIFLSQFLAIEAVASSATFTLMQAFMATNKPGMSTILQLVGLSIAVPLMFLLLPRIGLLGAAVALLASTLVRLITAMLCFPILLKAPIPNLLMKASDVQFLRDSLQRRARAGEA